MSRTSSAWRHRAVLNGQKTVFAAMLALAVFAAGTFVLPSPRKFVYTQTNVASDTGLIGPHPVDHLADPWGLVQAGTGEWWVANHREGMLLALSGEGEPAPDNGVILPSFAGGGGMPSRPTGIVYNETADFILSTGKPARIIAVTQDGIIAAWNREAGDGAALTVADKSAYAAYTGVALGRMNGVNTLFAANFRTGTIDVFDTFFQQEKTGENLFVDPTVPYDYSPFNVLFRDGKLYVLYALQDASHSRPAAAVGDRFITVFDMEGRPVQRLAPGQGYESAWAMAFAPPEFGRYANMLLLGNSLNGTIAAIDPATGAFRGFLGRPDGRLVTIPGLRGMAFDRTGGGRQARLYFCAATEDGEHGLFGYIMPGP